MTIAEAAMVLQSQKKSNLLFLECFTTVSILFPLFSNLAYRCSVVSGCYMVSVVELTHVIHINRYQSTISASNSKNKSSPHRTASELRVAVACRDLWVFPRNSICICLYPGFYLKTTSSLTGGYLQDFDGLSWILYMPSTDFVWHVPPEMISSLFGTNAYKCRILIMHGSTMLVALELTRLWWNFKWANHLPSSWKIRKIHQNLRLLNTTLLVDFL